MKVKIIIESIISFLNPFNNDFDATDRIIGLSGTSLFILLPSIVKNFMKAFEVVFCDFAEEEHQNICHEYFGDASYYTNLVTYGTAVLGEYYIMNKILH